MLAPSDSHRSSSVTNLSRSVSLSILDENGTDVGIETTADRPIELFLPRDPSISVSPMVLQDVLSTDQPIHNQHFYLHYVNVTAELARSIHLEIAPVNPALAYLFIYAFDRLPQLNSTISQIDGWTLFCPASNVKSGVLSHRNTRIHS